METTTDGLLNRRVTLEQPAQGYRVAIDTVLLAAAVPAKMGERALELGCGAGGAMLCLACRVPDIEITGVEIQPELVQLARRNIAHNGREASMRVIEGDVAIVAIEAGGFDHVLMNPPYHEGAAHDASPLAGKRMANTENPGDLKIWIAAASRALKQGGTLTLIHRADRLEEILGDLAEDFGGIEILPIVPKEGQPPKRVILRAKKGGGGTARHARALILHKIDGGYGPDADAILRHAAALDFA